MPNTHEFDDLGLLTEPLSYAERISRWDTTKQTYTQIYNTSKGQHPGHVETPSGISTRISTLSGPINVEMSGASTNINDVRGTLRTSVRTDHSDGLSFHPESKIGKTLARMRGEGRIALLDILQGTSGKTAKVKKINSSTTTLSGQRKIGPHSPKEKLLWTLSNEGKIIQLEQDRLEPSRTKVREELVDVFLQALAREQGLDPKDFPYHLGGYADGTILFDTALVKLIEKL